MIDKLARCITDSTELNTFAIRGLKMAGVRVSAHLNNFPTNITRAATEVLNEWRKDNRDQTVAYEKIKEALEAAGMAFYIDQALK